MLVGIIGGGVVGRATARCFMEHTEVRVYDKVAERSTHNLAETLDTDLIFVCLPTPQKVNSLECDTSAIEEFFAARLDPTKNFAIRSTVRIGFTNQMRQKHRLSSLVHSPEFLTARCSITDVMVPARNIVGIPGVQHVDTDLTNICGHVLENIYLNRFPGVPCKVMTSDESEAVKLILNGFFAVKVAYFNENRTLCDAKGLDWDRVMEGVMSDGRIAHSHTQVPGPDGKFGFGGACLPKDLANLIQCHFDVDLSPEVAYGAHVRNKGDRKR